MNQVLLIFADEWRYLVRSRLALAVTAVFVTVLVTLSVLNALRIETENHQITHQQEHAEETFLSQPDRHPHRMVHYGHYVFRAPAPLASFDPGLDAVTGKAMFLEGHRQNSATFSDTTASAYLGDYAWLSPATLYQVFGPLLIIVLAHGAIVREREVRTLSPLLAQGVSSNRILLGKSLAYMTFVLALLLPLVISALLAVSRGESLLVGLWLVAFYFLYLSVWALLAIAVSSLIKKRSQVLATLASLWLFTCLVMPSLAVNLSSNVLPLAGKIESELALIMEVKGLSDGHNAADAAFDQMRAELLESEGVETLEELSINFRGLVAQQAEEDLTEYMNLYAEERMHAEQAQADLFTSHGWLSPLISVAAASRNLSGTDLAHYHRFQRQAEEIRYDFVQGLNKVHAEQLSYTDDINRSRDEASSARTRMDAANWQVLDTYAFEVAPVRERLSRASQPFFMLALWALASLLLAAWSGRRLEA